MVFSSECFFALLKKSKRRRFRVGLRHLQHRAGFHPGISSGREFAGFFVLFFFFFVRKYAVRLSVITVIIPRTNDAL